jgi:hypothetical protein
MGPQTEAMMKDGEKDTATSKVGRPKKVAGVGLGLALGALAGILAGLVAGVGMAMILGIL